MQGEKYPALGGPGVREPDLIREEEETGLETRSLSQGSSRGRSSVLGKETWEIVYFENAFIKIIMVIISICLVPCKGYKVLLQHYIISQIL